MKYDGYRMMVIRDGDRVGLLSRGRHDYTKRFPWIVEAARERRQRQFVIDGEAVLLAFHRISDFDGLHSGKYDEEVQLYAFDILALDGDDLRKLPLSLRKQHLARLLKRRRQTNAVDKAIGERIRVRRLELHSSQADLGRELGITFQQLQKYEKVPTGSHRHGCPRWPKC